MPSCGMSAQNGCVSCRAPLTLLSRFAMLVTAGSEVLRPGVEMDVVVWGRE